MDKLPGVAMPLGSVMVDLASTEMQPHEKERLMDPQVAGVILFTRNFESIEQLTRLTAEIHALRHPKLLIGVDHEGGRVQRFRQGFTRLPAMGKLGQLYEKDPPEALKLAEQVGWVMATELLACGVDFSFAPVVDLDYGDSRVIGDRAFHQDAVSVSRLAFQLMKGMHEAGMASVAKHFPGHGYIEADTHLEVAVDERDLMTITQQDLRPFLNLIENGIEAMMPAHVRYPKVDALPAGFSRKWLQEILRKQCHFEGAIISDDLSMQAAVEWGSPAERVKMALQAGCDLVLMCNDPKAADEVLAKLSWQADALSHARLIRLHGRPHSDYHQLQHNPIWQSYAANVSRFYERTEQQELAV